MMNYKQSLNTRNKWFFHKTIAINITCQQYNKVPHFKRLRSQHRLHILKYTNIQDSHIKILPRQPDKGKGMIQQAVNFVFKEKHLTYNPN